MKYTVGFYEKENGEIPMLEFLDSLPKKQKAKSFWEIDLLKEFGTELKEPYSKAMNGDDYKGIWELRVKFAKDVSRIFYFMPVSDTFILLHGFLKKTEKTPKIEIETAKRYMDDYMRRFLK